MSQQETKSPKPKKTAAEKKPKIKFSLFSRTFKFLFGLGFALGLTLLIGFVFYAAKIDKDVRTKFEGKRWDIPAQAYARALELFPGKSLSQNELILELNLLGYLQTDSLDTSGTYKVGKNSIELVSRDFKFWDAEEKSKHLTLSFENGKIKQLKNINSEEEFLVRLDPLPIGSFYPGKGEDRVLTRLEDLPDIIPQTLIAVEDKAFMSHFGINPLAIARAIIVNLKAGRTVQGGSTITQQLAKNFYLSQERTLKRKIKEAVTAILLELHYSKAQIMETYLNDVYLAQNGNREIYGIDITSAFFFGRKPTELNTAQVASIIALLKAPTSYNPRLNPERALDRRNLILKILKDDKIITEAEYETEIARDLGLSKNAVFTNLNTPYPDFMGLVKEQLLRDYKKQDLLTEGIKVFTTLDPLIQVKAEKSVVEQMPKLDKRAGFNGKTLEAASVICQIETGEVVALIGSRDFRLPGFNRAVDARRQIGSLIKPLIYLSALEKADIYTLATPLDDSKLQVKSGGKMWRPDNYDHKQHGSPFLITALAKSYNLATARLGIDIGVQTVVEKLRKFGFDEHIDPYPALLLGAVSMSPVQVAQYYLTLANKGFKIPVNSIRSVTDKNGEPLKSYDLEITQVTDEKTAFLTYKAMREVIKSGTAAKVNKQLKQSLNIAGKTGTTNESRDSWFAGFSGNYLTVNWVGRDDNKPSHLSGSSGALRLWIDTMKRLNLKKYEFAAPSGIEYAWVHSKNGKLSNKNCKYAVRLPFVAGTSPFIHSSCRQQKQVSNKVEILEAIENPENKHLPAPETRARKKTGFTDWLFRKNLGSEQNHNDDKTDYDLIFSN